MQKRSTKADWQKYWLSDDHQPTVIHEELLTNLEKAVDVNKKKILEIGAGMGGDSIYLAKKGAVVSVLDFTQEALNTIRGSAKNQQVKIDTILADAKKIPLKDESLDIIFHQGFLEHFQDPDIYLKEQWRVLKKGGLLAVDVPQKYTMYTLKKHRQMKQGKWFAGWETEFSIMRLEKLLKKNGFRIISSYGWGYFGKLHKLRYLKLGPWYKKLWQILESSRLKLYLTFAIGVVAQKI